MNRSQHVYQPRTVKHRLRGIEAQQIGPHGYETGIHPLGDMLRIRSHGAVPGLVESTRVTAHALHLLVSFTPLVASTPSAISRCTFPGGTPQVAARAAQLESIAVGAGNTTSRNRLGQS